MIHEVVDLVSHANSDYLLQNFKTFVKNNCQEDPLYDNYVNLDLDDFICLTAVLENNEIVALSGVQSKPDRWGNNLVRMSTRFWMHPKYRITTLSKFKPDMRFYFNSQAMIPYQLNFLKTLNLKFAIITREGNYRKSFKKFIELVNHHNNTNFTVIDGLYNVCQHMDIVPESCQQIIAVHSFDNSNFQEELEILQKENKLKTVTR